jgi:hypothetical protein
MYAGALKDVDNTYINKNNEGAIRADFNVGASNGYYPSDLNMDGSTDGIDIGLVKPNRTGGVYAPTQYFMKR